MAIALRGAAVVPSGNPTTTFTVVVDSNVAADDVLFLTVVSRDSTGLGSLTVTDDDSGGNTWTLIGNSTDHKATLWYKRATSGTASKTVTLAGAVGKSAGVLKAFSGALTSGNPYTNVTVETNNSGDESATGITPDNSDSMLCAAIYNYVVTGLVTSLSSVNFGTFDTTEKTVGGGGNDVGSAFGHDLVTSGPSGNITWAQTNGNGYSIIWAIAPAAVEIIGTLDATLGSLSPSSEIDVLVDGDLSATLGVATLASEVDALVDGDLISTLGNMTLEASGTVAEAGIEGTLNVSLENLTVSSEIDVLIQGSEATTFENLSISSEVDVLIDSDLSSNLANLTSASEVDILIDSDLVSTLANLISASEVDVLVDGDLISTLENLAISSNIDVFVDGDLVSTLDSLGISNESDVLVDGDLVSTLANLTNVSEVDVLVEGVLTKTLDSLIPSSEVDILVESSTTSILDSLVSSSEVDVLVQGSTTKLLSDISLEAFATSQAFAEGTLNVTLGNLTFSSEGDVLVDGDLASILENLAISSEADVYIKGIQTSILNNFDLNSEVDLLIQANTSSTLEPLILYSIPEYGVIGQLLVALDGISDEIEANSLIQGILSENLQTMLLSGSTHEPEYIIKKIADVKYIVKPKILDAIPLQKPTRIAVVTKG